MVSGTKLQQVIMAVLGEMKQPVLRTKLVKLVYLIDYIYFRHYGKTLTGLDYVWSHYGPNPPGHAVAAEAKKLVGEGLVDMMLGANYYGSPQYEYTAVQKMELDLAADEMLIIRDTVRRYRDYSIREIVRAAKDTEPFKSAKQYEVLRMKQSYEFSALSERLSGDEAFGKGIEEGVKADQQGLGVSLQEVEADLAS